MNISIRLEWSIPSQVGWNGPFNSGQNGMDHFIYAGMEWFWYTHFLGVRLQLANLWGVLLLIPLFWWGGVWIQLPQFDGVWNFLIFPTLWKKFGSRKRCVCYRLLQGVPQYCLHFSFVNFSTSKAHRSSILDIFQQPFLCGFQNYQICYYLVQFWLRYYQNTKRKSLKKLRVAL